MYNIYLEPINFIKITPEIAQDNVIFIAVPAELLRKIEQLEKQIEMMKNCHNCKGFSEYRCSECKNYDKWEAKE